MAGLTLVPSPVGNLGDITMRALEVLKNADLILAEDTRKTGILLKHYGINKPVISHHQFNEHKTLSAITRRLAAGEHVAMLSDAGTPGISDPGYLLVRECIREGIEVECLPGPTALIPALVVSGLPCDHFLFAGFLPHKKGRVQQLTALAQSEYTVVLYESPFRLLKTLQQLSEHFGPERPAAVVRELTKIHEEIVRGSLAEIVTVFQNRASIKGEIVIVAGGNKA